MRHSMKTRALRPLVLAACLGAALGGCGLPHYGDGRGGYYGSSGYYSSPSYYSSRGHHRGGGHHGSSSRTENWSQGRLQQHWLNQAQRPR